MSGLRVSLFTPWHARCGVRDYSRHLIAALTALPEIVGVRVVEAPQGAARASAVAALRHYLADEKRFRALGAAMNAEGAEVAHVQHQYFFFGGVAPYKSHVRAFLSAVRVPLVMTVHEIALPGPSASAPQRAALTLANRRNFLHPVIRRYIVHTEADRAHLAAIGVPADRIHVLTHGVPPPSPLPEPERAREALGLEGKRVVTLFGFLSAKKGHTLALEALRQLPPDVVLLFAGDRHPEDFTDYVPNLRAQIQARGLANRVHITGYLPDERLPLIMAATDVGLAPYMQTSGSGSLANLLAYGRAIVASDIPPHQEIVRKVPASLALFRSGDTEDLAAKLLTALEDASCRAALQAAARAYADRYSYENMAREAVAIYRLARQEV
ncbi:MAG TPA: glycosyltransferase [Chthonomonadaceae bacterium]|nr:glycosyltransferase [Chthonomonadaceae bacterium]